MSDRLRPNLEELPPHIPGTFTPAQIMSAIVRGTGKTLAAYHTQYHTPRWKRILMRLAAEVESFKSAVNEQYGPMHARGELWWQRAARWVRALPARLRRPPPQRADDEVLERELRRIEGEKVKHIDRRAGRNL